jgi:pSer/pThr/pTyr-binding forkhead associated (FHA) protein
MIRDLNSSNGVTINNQKLKNGKFTSIKTGDLIKFGKETSPYTFENNLNQLQVSMTTLTDEQTLVYPSLIRDERISLVDETGYKKATRNHLENRYILDESSLKNKNSGVSSLQEKYNDTEKNENQIQNKYYEKLSKNPYPSNKITTKNNLSQSSSQYGDNIDSPKFNNSLQESQNLNPNNNPQNIKINQNNDLNMTFKNSKENPISLRNMQPIIDSNLYENLKSKIDIFSKDNKSLSEKNLQLETLILQKTNENKKLSNNIESINENYSKLNAKHNALLLYASDIQKKIDLVLLDLEEKKVEIHKFTTTDWGKTILEKDSLNKLLQNEIQLLKSEYSKIKNFIADKNELNASNQRLDTLLQNYLNENKKYKKIVEEYRARENECNKKWNELIKENNQNSEKSLLIQTLLNQQIEHFNNIISDYDKRVIDCLNNIPQILEDPKKSEAAQYLINQMNLIMEEKRKLMKENSLMEERIHILNFENEKLKAEINLVQADKNTISNNQHPYSNFESINKQLKMKIEELEDLVTQFKMTNSPNKIAELEQQIISSNEKICEKEKKIESLMIKFKEFSKKTNMVFDEREIVTSLSNALKERDLIIISLKNQLRDIKEVQKVKNVEIENLNRQLERSDHIESKIYFYIYLFEYRRFKLSYFSIFFTNNLYI